MPPTFTEEVAGYSTVSPGSSSTTTLPESVVVTSSISGVSNILIASSTSGSTSAGALATASKSGSGTAAAASSTSTTSSSSDDGTSTATKAGVAIGILGGLLVVGLLVFFLFSRRRKQMQKQQADNEKMNRDVGGAAAADDDWDRRASFQTTKTSATAPRLSLRPVTQFFPNFGERRSSKGAAIALSMAPSSQQSSRPVGESLWERPGTSQSNQYENPFGHNAERLDAVSERSVPVSSYDLQPTNPFNAPENVVGMAQTTDSPPKSSPLAAAAGAGAMAGVALTRKQSARKAPQALDLTKAAASINALGPIPAAAPSPAGTEFSMTELEAGQAPGPSKSANAIAAAGGPVQSTVHRVELDFKPTLEDEMELKAGQLVRLLHEYDDGWALCIRLDRSQQGVVPRTCLSTRPVKPRPAGPPGARPGPPVNPSGGPRGPPRGPGQRPMTPQGGPGYPRPESPMRPMNHGGRPQSPAMFRPQSPAGMGPRAMSPGPGQQSQSSGPRQRGYSQSSVSSRRMSPPGFSPMNPASSNAQQQSYGPNGGPVGRKPVPGQAY
ncbi:hypothetical protein BX600DRAFT_504515 [Xylariales sp. PMI_506]|nr:hypothetical protein BX600DRAFT_504515 [Xylariales sp. PMI_506]